jgi:hypothetical protein
MSKFDFVDGKIDEDQIQLWCEEFFFNMLNLLNAFFSHVDIKDAAERMSLIPFDQLVCDQLQDESEEVRAIASKRIMELAEIEISHLEAYGD